MLYLHGIGHFNPENMITNPFLEELDIGTTNEWILERVGIQNRRTVLPLEYIKKRKTEIYAQPLKPGFIRMPRWSCRRPDGAKTRVTKA